MDKVNGEKLRAGNRLGVLTTEALWLLERFHTQICNAFGWKETEYYDHCAGTDSLTPAQKEKILEIWEGLNRTAVRRAKAV